MSAPVTDPKVPAAAFIHNDIHLIRIYSPGIIQHTWANNRLEWGKTTDVETYFARETLLSNQDFTSNGKLKFWALVPKSFGQDHPNLDHVLCAVETFERPGIVATKNQGVKDVLSVSVASVFTPPQSRGHGYASLMMKSLWEEIKKMDNVSFTFLYSDVGPTFYGRIGWTPRRSDEIVIPTSHFVIDQSPSPPARLANVTDDDLTSLINKDAQLLREELKKRAESSGPEKIFVAATPEPSCIRWLTARSRFTAQYIRKLEQHDITVLGARDTKTDSFALYFHHLLEDQLYIIRWRLDPKAGEETARALIQAAQAEAKKWNLSKVVIWNPEQSLADLLGLQIKHRDDALP
ncbi:hypothetical protein BC939DRAFT_460742, partial [Gamsiella multidivaricata]|uniref:uncharacterized protein n=1 Tax=Gamsiella multidivaricata TaxID=101098 RepID=UPI00221FD507